MTAAASPVVTPGIARPAPDFTLPSTSGQPVHLADLRGHTVLIAFFPLAFTSTCTAELCAMRDDYDQFRGRDVVILPISVDSVPTLREYKARYEMQTDLLSDFKREVSRLYGVLNEEKFHSRRSYFLVDREGVLRWSHVETVGGMRRDNAELIGEIDKLA